MSINDYMILKLRKAINLCLVLIVLLSLSNSFIFQFIDSPIVDSIECADSSEGEREAEKESEKKGVDDEFIGTLAFGQYTDMSKINSERTHCCFNSNAYIVITTPPPQFT